MSAEVIPCLFSEVKKALGGMPVYSLRDGVPIKLTGMVVVPGFVVVGKNHTCLEVQVKHLSSRPARWLK
jgi:hypothetical protein